MRTRYLFLTIFALLLAAFAVQASEETEASEEAEAVYVKALEKFRENGWALFGLLESLRAQGKTREARAVEARFRKSWALADVVLTSSRF